VSDIQALVDALAVELNRPVGIDDRRFRAIAYSSHEERVDQVRLASIVRREAPREVTTWIEELGVVDAERFVRMPANESFGMAARVCVPIRFDGNLLGFLWLLDEPTPLSEEQLAESLAYAEEMAVAIYRARLLEQDSRERERELASQALGLGGGEQEAAAVALLAGGHLSSAPAYLALVLRAHRVEGGEAPDPIRVRLVDSAEQLRRSMAPHHMLVVVADGEVVVVLASSSEAETERRAGALAAAAKEALHGEPGWGVLVGVGEESPSLESLPDSYRQGRDSVRVARALGRDEGFVRWSELGAYRTIAALVGRSGAAAVVPDSLLRLLACDEAETLTRTLECYLDLGGDARAAAEALYVHRSSLYGRLHRIEEVAEVDLRSGEDRLELHLGLRLWHLLGAGFPGKD
jgi:sugar diacid utilization regulator